MIFYFFLLALEALISAIFSWLPAVSIPDTLSTVLSLAVSYWNSLLLILPFLPIVWHSFLYVVLPFEISLLVLKFILGSRTPVNTN